MKLTLELPPSALVGESPPARLRLVNDGAAPIEAPDPALHPEAPALRVAGPDGDRTFVPAEVWAARGGGLRAPARLDQGPLATLAPGEALERAFPLLDRCDLPRAGRYALEAVAGEDRSPPAALEVLPVAPGAVVPEEALLDGPPSWLAWTSEAPAEGDGPGRATVLVRRVGFSELGALEPLEPSLRVGEAPAGERPVLSAPPAGEVAAERHVAWTRDDGARLAAVTVSLDGARTSAALDLESRGALLGPPVAEPAGGARLLVAREAAGGSELLVVRLQGERAAVEHRRPAGRERVAWGRLVAQAEGDRRALAVVPDRAKLRLLTLPWVRPAGAPADAEAVPAAAPAALLEVEGRFAAADAALDGAVVRGALLAWRTTAAGDERLVLVRWRLEGGALRAERPVPWAWPARLAGAPLLCRVDRAGGPHLLVRDEEGWAHAGPLEQPRRLAAAPGARPYVGPPGLTFVSAGPVVLWHRAATGLEALGLGFRLEPDPAELIQPDLLPEPAGGRP